MEEDKVIIGLILILLGLVGGGVCCLPIVLVIPGVILLVAGLMSDRGKRIIYVQQPGMQPPMPSYPQYQQPSPPPYPNYPPQYPPPRHP